MAKWKDSHLPRVRFSSVRFPVLGHEENQTERVRSTQIFSLLAVEETGLVLNRARIGLSYDPDNADFPGDRRLFDRDVVSDFSIKVSCRLTFL